MLAGDYFFSGLSTSLENLRHCARLINELPIGRIRRVLTILKLKLIYIASLVILGALTAFTVFKPMATDERHSEVQRAQLLEREDQWIIEFDIINQEGEDMSYTIKVLADGKLYTESVLIRDGGMFTYIHHFYPDRLTKNEVNFAVYKEGESTPVEQATYFLR